MDKPALDREQVRNRRRTFEPGAVVESARESASPSLAPGGTRPAEFRGRRRVDTQSLVRNLRADERDAVAAVAAAVASRGVLREIPRRHSRNKAWVRRWVERPALSEALWRRRQRRRRVEEEQEAHTPRNEAVEAHATGEEDDHAEDQQQQKDEQEGHVVEAGVAGATVVSQEDEVEKAHTCEAERVAVSTCVDSTAMRAWPVCLRCERTPCHKDQQQQHDADDPDLPPAAPQGSFVVRTWWWLGACEHIMNEHDQDDDGPCDGEDEQQPVNGRRRALSEPRPRIVVKCHARVARGANDLPRIVHVEGEVEEEPKKRRGVYEEGDQRATRHDAARGEGDLSKDSVQRCFEEENPSSGARGAKDG